MKRAISNRDVLTARFPAATFDGQWLRSIGRPRLAGTWIIFGGSGSGKTTFTLLLAKYLARFARVAYNSLEQGLSPTLQRAWSRVSMQEAGTSIVLLEREQLPDIRQRLKSRRPPNVIVIDSLPYLDQFFWRDYVLLTKMHPDTLFIFIAHEKNGHPGRSARQAHTVRRRRQDSRLRIQSLLHNTLRRPRPPGRRRRLHHLARGSSTLLGHTTAVDTSITNPNTTTSWQKNSSSSSPSSST